MAASDNSRLRGGARSRRRRSAVLATVLAAGTAALALPRLATAAETPQPSVARNGATVARNAVAHNGAAAGRFEVSSRSPSMIASALRPTGRRMYSGSASHMTVSYNWSGLATIGSHIQGALGRWTVPLVRSSRSAKYSASWVGVDGATNADLIQTGTSQDTSDGYSAWWEILPAYSVPIVTKSGAPAPVRPGDKMTGEVVETSTGIWEVSLVDGTQHWFFDSHFHYDGPGRSAEWIEEAPTVGGNQSVPPDFGTVHFRGTEVYGSFGQGRGWYGTAMNGSNEIAMVNRAGNRILAQPSALSPPSSRGQSFNDTYVAH